MAAYIGLAAVAAVVVLAIAYKLWARHFPHSHGDAKKHAEKRILNKQTEYYHAHSEYPKTHVTAEDVLTKAGIRAKNTFLNAQENTFYEFLEKNFGEKYHVSCKVQSSKLFSYDTNAVKKAANSWGKKFYKIYYSRCVDYVLFLKTDPAFFFAVQFRNNSPSEEVRARREKNLLGLFRAAQLPYYLADPALLEKDPAAFEKGLKEALAAAFRAYTEKKAAGGALPGPGAAQPAALQQPADKS